MSKTPKDKDQDKADQRRDDLAKRVLNTPPQGAAEDAWNAGVAAERERCAKIADDVDDRSPCNPAAEVARRIRSPDTATPQGEVR